MLGDNRSELDIDLSDFDIFQSIGSIRAIVIKRKLRSNQSVGRGLGTKWITLNLNGYAY